MAEIDIMIMNDNVYRVTVSAKSITTHDVDVQLTYAQKLTGGKISTEELVKKSFEFLLQREANNSILRRFDLSVIAHYFPEYEREITKHIHS